MDAKCALFRTPRSRVLVRVSLCGADALSLENMGKRETSGAQRAEKKKKRSAKGGASVGPSQGSSTGGVSGPVPVRKIPSLRGKHQVGLYAAGSFQNAPSPRRLPQPPSKWMRDAARASSSDAAMMPPPQPVLRRESSVVAELQVCHRRALNAGARWCHPDVVPFATLASGQSALPHALAALSRPRR